MKRIKRESIDDVKELAIYDVVSHYVQLKKAGANWRAPSPFNDEKTPSFWVVPAKNIFKDFSSGKGGGGINFVMEFHQHRLTFIECVKEIADKCNVILQYEDISTEEQREVEDKKEGLYMINAAAARAYVGELKQMIDAAQDHVAIAELSKRKWTADTYTQWQLGYAPGEGSNYEPQKWKFLTDLVGAKSYAGAKELGLIKTKENDITYDAFRHRLMFPIHNAHGRIVGFGGRDLGDGKQAKYINSSDSVLFKKETVLYGLYFASEAIRKCGYAYLMEGNADVVSFHQAGYNMSVATCGTALTDEQCKLLKRYCTRVVMVGDGDSAGEKSMLRNLDILLRHGFQVDLVPMPKFEDGRKVDPDDLTRLFEVIEVNIIIGDIEEIEATAIPIDYEVEVAEPVVVDMRKRKPKK